MFLLSVLAVAFVGSRVPQASVLTAMSVAELAASADTIVVGKVTSTTSAWDPSHRRILSTIGIDVEERWKGIGPGRVVVVQPGGTVGDIEMSVDGMPTFTLGERALLFLRGHDRFGVVGMALGKRSVHWDADRAAWFVESPAADNVFQIGEIGEIGEIGSTGKLHPALVEQRSSLESVRAYVRSLTGGS